MPAKARHISIIIPVFNEQSRIAKTLFEIKDYLSKQTYTSDIIIINDGSNDLTTEVVKVVDIYGEEIKSQQPTVIVDNAQNVGKGYSIAKGMLIAKGDVIVFTDADASTPITEINKLLDQIDAGFDMVVGSRNLDASAVKDRSVLRHLSGRCFNLLASALGLISISDSQCGFKAYRKELALDLAQRQKTNGFSFDVEHIFMASKLGYTIKDVPVEWHHENGSTISLLSDSFSMFFDMLKIRWLHRDLGEPQSK